MVEWMVMNLVAVKAATTVAGKAECLAALKVVHSVVHSADTMEVLMVG